MTRVPEGRRGKGQRRARTGHWAEDRVRAASPGIEDELRLHGVGQVGGPVRSIGAAMLGVADIHATAVEVHLIIGNRLRCRGGGGEGRAGGRIVVGGVERGGHGVGVEHVCAEGVVVHHGRTHGREAKVLLERTSRADDGVFVHLKGIYGEGDLGLGGGKGGWLHGVLVERVLVQVGLCLGVGGDHDAVHGRHLGGGFGAPLGWLIRR